MVKIKHQQQFQPSSQVVIGGEDDGARGDNISSDEDGATNVYLGQNISISGHGPPAPTAGSSKHRGGGSKHHDGEAGGRDSPSTSTSHQQQLVHKKIGENEDDVVYLKQEGELEQKPVEFYRTKEGLIMKTATRKFKFYFPMNDSQQQPTPTPPPTATEPTRERIIERSEKLIQDRSSDYVRETIYTQPPVNDDVGISYTDSPPTGYPGNAPVDGRSALTVADDNFNPSVPVGRLADLQIRIPTGSSPANLIATVSDPNGRTLQSNVSEGSNGRMFISFIPQSVGFYRISVLRNNRHMKGSPFRIQAYDGSQVRITNLEAKAVNQTGTFLLDASRAGTGTLEVSVSVDGKTIPNAVRMIDDTHFEVQFTPTVAKTHYIKVLFNGQPVPGSPFELPVIGPSLQQTLTRTEYAKGYVNQTICLEIQRGPGIYKSDYEISVTDPSGSTLPYEVVNHGDASLIEFVPMKVGHYRVDVRSEGQPINASPYFFYINDLTKIVIQNFNNEFVPAIPQSFIVDASAAGRGDLAVEVKLKDQPLNVECKNLGSNRYEFQFTPATAENHQVDVMFDGRRVQGFPRTIKPRVSSSSRYAVPDDRPDFAYGFVDKQVSLDINITGLPRSDVHAEVRDPDGNSIPSTMDLRNNICHIEFLPSRGGRYRVDLTCSDTPHPDSPFICRVADPQALKVNIPKTLIPGQPHEFFVDATEGGRGELGVVVRSGAPYYPNGLSVPVECQMMSPGYYKFTFIAKNPSDHFVHISFGNIRLQGSPFVVSCRDSMPVLRSTPPVSTASPVNLNLNGLSLDHKSASPPQHQPPAASLITASGEGLVSAEEDKAATFVVHTSSQRGNLYVQVDGPNSVAKCKTQDTIDGKIEVTYTPVEVGTFTIHVQWNEKDIQGSPFHPNVYNLEKISLVSPPLNSANQIELESSSPKVVQFDSSGSGPGNFEAEVVDMRGRRFEVVIPPSQVNRVNLHLPQLDLHEPGDSALLYVSFNKKPIPKSPFKLIVPGSPPSPENREVVPFQNQQSLTAAPGGYTAMQKNSRTEYQQQQQQYTDRISAGLKGSNNNLKLILFGKGARNAWTLEEASFIIDSSMAGEGTPEVKLEHSRSSLGSVSVNLQQIAKDRWKCSYIPDNQGSHNLFVSWNGRYIEGSPFPVSVVTSSARTVNLNTDELQGMICGGEYKLLIDTTNSPAGELWAKFDGPRRPAHCELHDRFDGTYYLHLFPNEAGPHKLLVKFNEEHVKGSPFQFVVQRTGDPSRVRVHGPGTQSGLMNKFDSRFFCDVHEAGPGDLTVRVRGPRGAFRVEMAKHPQDDQRVECRYQPSEAGTYHIIVTFDDIAVPGSPFTVMLFEKRSDVQRFQKMNAKTMGHGQRQRMSVRSTSRLPPPTSATLNRINTVGYVNMAPEPSATVGRPRRHLYSRSTTSLPAFYAR